MSNIVLKSIRRSIAYITIFSLTFSGVPLSLSADLLETGLTPNNGSNIATQTVIGLGAQQVNGADYSALQHAYQYIFDNSAVNTSDLLLYPESFSHTNGLTTTEFPDGAFIKLNDETMPADAADIFNYKQATSSATIGRARALYDGHIAILDLSKTIANQNRHLTYEAESYCHLLHTYLAKHEQCFHGYGDYQAYLADEDFPVKEATSIVMLNADDIQANRLLSGTDPFFKILILPDLTLGLENEVLTELEASGISAIEDYVRRGGTIIASGKSAWLLEQFGLLDTGTVDKNIIVKNQGNKGRLNFTAQTDFDSKLLRMGLIPENDDSYKTYFLSSYFITPEIDADLTPVATLDFADANYYFRNTAAAVIEKPATDGLAVAWKKYDQGKVYLFAGQPASGTDKYYPFVFNAVFAGLARDIIPTLKVFQKTNPDLAENIIPGLEDDVKLGGRLNITNYFDQAISEVAAVINIAHGYEIENPADLPADCAVTALNGNATYAHRIKCAIAQINGFASSTIDFDLRITDPSITQKKYGILAATAQITYTRAGGETQKANTGGAYLTAYRGAEIRAEYNPDPSSFYPLKGEGVYIDNVLTAENKEDTDAEEVEHIAIVPLVSPIVDGDDQSSLAYTLEFYNDYYQDRKATSSFVFPFINSTESNRDYDYLDYQTLKCSDITLSADWDTPVQTVLMSRADTGLPAALNCAGNTLNQITNKDYAYAINNESLVAKQLFFADAADYYEQATQRQLVYINTTKEGGADSYYQGNIPADMNNGSVAKKRLVFARNDIYFYPNKNYVLPQGIADANSYLSLDRYATSTCGDADGLMHAGYFDDTRVNGTEPNNYDNALACRHGKTKIDLAQIEASSGGQIQVSHYLFPIADGDDIDAASDLADFDTASGTYANYPEVRFIKAHTIDFLLTQADTPKGGRFIFTLPNDVNFNSDPLADELITFSADHVAIRNIDYATSTKTITADFIRGKMPDQTHGQPDVLRLNLENLDTTAPIIIGARLQSLNYDLNNPDNIAIYTDVDFDATLTLSQKPFLQLPSVIMKFRLARGENSDESYFQKYEFFEPFARYGVYIQELAEHRTVYGYTENHPVTDPGLVLESNSFSTFSNIGASSIPFREFLQTGTAQVIPSSPQTARVDYQDIWKRQWSTPIRTVMPDVPPIPPPLRNFVMNTTFEMRDKETGARQLDWTSDRSAEVLYKVKLLNNYPKYFELTVCKENELLINADQVGTLYEKYFTDPDLADIYSGTSSLAMLYLHRSNTANYGACYQTEGDKAANQILTEEQRTLIGQAQVCENKEDCPDMSGIPTISKRPAGETGNWNHSLAVENYFPADYTDESMWSMTHYDYADNAFAKGYPYHMDNALPNLDNIRKGYIRPHNIVAQPVYKGLGYSLSYDPNYQAQYYSVDGNRITGWQSDNLQNQDDTLLGGQATGNTISVDKSSFMTDKFISLNDLQNADEAVSNAQKNIYACLFNPWRAGIDPTNPNIVYPDNVYLNNVVPILPDLTKNDSRLTNYNCDDTNYTPNTIHSVDNIVETDAKDWLYFGVGLRGGAKETINIISQLDPISDVNYEGFAKINDGGRFTYWNPANGPNSFIVLDNVANVIEAVQSKLTLTKEIIPVEVPTFNADIYHLITVKDEAETNREFTESPYLKNYGFGDAVTAVQVGVAENLNANGSILEPGDTTAVKVELFNNSGYDWNLIKSSDGEMAIEADNLPPEAINANDFLYKIKHAIKQPTKFNFLTFDIPAEIADYIEITPSTSNIKVAGILFDFDNINVTTIRDGFKGTYAINLKVAADFPEDLRGKTYDIGVSLVPKFFDRYPGHASDIVAHDYTLAIPGLRIGVPYGAGHGTRTGKVYRTSGSAHDISIIDEMPIGVEPEMIKKISGAELQSFRSVANTPEQRQTNLAALFDDTGFGESFTFDAEATASSTKRLTIDLAANGISQFPIPQADAPDTSTIYLLAKSVSNYLPFGENQVNKNLLTNYIDQSAFAKTTNMSDPQYRIARAAGADLQTTYDAQLIGATTGEVLNIQTLSPEGDNYIKVDVRLENIGSALAFRPQAKIYLADNIELVSGGTLETIGTSSVVSIDLPSEMAPGDFEIFSIILKYDAEPPLAWWRFWRPAMAAEEQIEIIDHAEANFDLTPAPNENNVNQNTAGNFYMSLADDSSPNPGLSITASRTAPNQFTVNLAAVNLAAPYFKLFTRTANNDFAANSFSQTSTYTVAIPTSGLTMYGAVYSRSIIVNEQGEEEYNYTKEAESGALFIDFNAENAGAIAHMLDKPRHPEDVTGNPLDFLIKTVDDLGQMIRQTYEQKIKLRLDGGPDAVKMAISEFADFRQAGQIAYDKLIDWTLSSGFGTKTIFAKFYTRFGISSETVSTDIELAARKVAETKTNLISSQKEAQLIHQSGRDLKPLLQNMNKKRRHDREKYGLRKFVKKLAIKKLTNKQRLALNNFIMYGSPSTIKLSWQARFEILKKYQAKFGKLPTTITDWEWVIEHR